MRSPLSLLFSKKSDILLKAAYTHFRPFKDVLCLCLKYKNSESNMNYGHIHAAKKLGGLGSGGGLVLAGRCWPVSHATRGSAWCSPGLTNGRATYFKCEGLLVASWWAQLSSWPPCLASQARSLGKGSLTLSCQVL